MAKEKIKAAKIAAQGGLDALTGAPLPERLSLVDTHRLVPKAAGGQYDGENYIVTDPVEHMKEHGIYRERSEQLDAIKSMMDDRRQIMKLTMKIQNQLLAYERQVDTMNDMTAAWLRTQLEHVKEQLAAREKIIEKAVKEYAKVDRVTAVTLAVKGVGPITVANLITYIDLAGVHGETMVRGGKEIPNPRAGQEKCRHASALWAYAGFDKPSHDRYTKGTASGGNKTLRTALYVWASVQIKQGGPYREVYDQVKTRLENSEKVTQTRNTQGRLVEAAWKDVKPGHRHGAAMRAMMKHFLADYWFVGRTILGLSTSPLYAESMLGHDGHRTISPKERGWAY